jgi:hypothetical protein
LSIHLTDSQPDDPPVTVTLMTGQQPLTVRVANGHVETEAGAHEPDLVVAGSPGTVLNLLLGRMSVSAARRCGISISGAAQALRRIQPAR